MICGLPGRLVLSALAEALSAIPEKHLRQEYSEILSSEQISHLFRDAHTSMTVELEKYLILTMKRLQSAPVLRRVPPRLTFPAWNRQVTRDLDGSGCFTSHRIQVCRCNK